MIEDQVLFHLTKFGKIILSLLTFPDPLKGRDEAVPQGLRSASLNPVATQIWGPKPGMYPGTGYGYPKNVQCGRLYFRYAYYVVHSF